MAKKATGASIKGLAVTVETPRSPKTRGMVPSAPKVANSGVKKA